MTNTNILLSEAIASLFLYNEDMETIDTNTIYLKTKRLIIRPWTKNDFDDFYAYAKDNVGLSAGWMKINDEATAHIFLKHFIEDHDTLAIIYNNKAIGNISIKLLKDKQQCAKIGYVLGKDYWNQGIMTESLKAMIDYCFKELRLDAIYAEYLSNNLASAKVLKKCGFKVIKQFNSTLIRLKDEESFMVELKRENCDYKAIKL